MVLKLNGASVYYTEQIMQLFTIGINHPAPFFALSVVTIFKIVTPAPQFVSVSYNLALSMNALLSLNICVAPSPAAKLISL